MQNQLSSNRTAQVASLVETYHVLFDLWEAKQALPFRERVDVLRPIQAARSAIDDVLRYEYGIDRPERYDGDGRTVENGGIPKASVADVAIERLARIRDEVDATGYGEAVTVPEKLVEELGYAVDVLVEDLAARSIR